MYFPDQSLWLSLDGQLVQAKEKWELTIAAQGLRLGGGEPKLPCLGPRTSLAFPESLHPEWCKPASTWRLMEFPPDQEQKFHLRSGKLSLQKVWG